MNIYPIQYIRKKNTKYTFVHPTKCGGCAVEDFLNENYSHYFSTEGHYNKCKYDNDSIIIVRDPVDRFKSMYKYWKYGSERHQINEEHIENFKDVNIKTFISMIKNNSNNLITKFTQDIHYKPITHWINTTYNNIIILKYNKDLNNTIQKMISKMNIPNKVNKLVKHTNISKTTEEIVLDDDDLLFIKKYFISDYYLIYLINKHPKMFRGVF
jgi:hypothetical protein